MIKAVLLDLDGTILDRESSLNKFIDYQYDKFLNFLNHYVSFNHGDKRYV